MAKQLDEVSTGGFEYEFFKGADYGVGTLFLVEPKASRTYESKWGDKEALDADVVSFVNKKPDAVAKVTFTPKGLVRPLVDHIGGAAALKLDQAPTDKGNPAWVWAQPTAAEKKAVQAYLNKREETADEPEDDDDFDPDAL